jgi:tetratricopeptide (TPR) repeat protein
MAWPGRPDPCGSAPLEVAARLLRKRTGDPDQHAAEALAEELGRLPLALEQAAAYTDQQHLSLARYLAMFRERRTELLARGQPLAYHGTVDAVFTLALDQLHQTDPAAGQLLQLCALLAPDEIPIGWLLGKPHLLPSPLADVARDPLRASEVTGVLYQAALLTPDVDDTARLHRLVQAVTLHQLLDNDRHELVARTVALLAALFPDQPGEPETWPVCARLRPHADTLIDHARSQQLATSALAELLHRMSIYIWARGLGLSRARDLDEQALGMRQRLYEGDHPQIAASLDSLAVDLYELGEYARARDLHQQALAMYRRLYKGDHPRIAHTLNNLAVALRELGEFKRARHLDEQALAMYRRLYKGDDPRIATNLNDLADDLRALGEHAHARDLHQEALAMRQRLYEGDHPQIADSLNDLAITVRALGEHAHARDLDERALAMRKRLAERDASAL